MTAPLVVYDTMVFLQAAIHPERRYATIEAVEDGRLTLCTSTELMAEVQDVLTRRSLSLKFSALTPERVAQLLDGVNALAKSFARVSQAFTWPQHPHDDHLFNLAIHAQARYLVTWETRLLELPKSSAAAAKLLHELAPDLSVVTPRELAEILKTSPSDAPSSTE